MLLYIHKAKIHRATITEANLNYVGSITIDEDLMEAAGIIEGEKVQIVNNNNGERGGGGLAESPSFDDEKGRQGEEDQDRIVRDVKMDRLVDWMAEILLDHTKKIVRTIYYFTRKNTLPIFRVVRFLIFSVLETLYFVHRLQYERHRRRKREKRT